MKSQAKYVLRLYVSGSTSKSALAVENIKRICEQHLKNRYDLEVIDIYQQPNLARDEQIVAVPTLIKRFPPPVRRLIGDLSNQKKSALRTGPRDAGVMACRKVEKGWLTRRKNVPRKNCRPFHAVN